MEQVWRGDQVGQSGGDYAWSKGIVVAIGRQSLVFQKSEIPIFCIKALDF